MVTSAIINWKDKQYYVGTDGAMVTNTTINYGGVTVNVYGKENQNIRELADEIEYRINNNVLRRRAAYGS